jgi:hypothetical protein
LISVIARKGCKLISTARIGSATMPKLNERTVANMEIVLEETCKVFPNGGEHECRRFIAERLKQRAMRGDVTLAGLRAVAHSALQEFSEQHLDRNLR